MVATDLSVLFVASVFGKHHGFEQVVVRCGHLIGAVAIGCQHGQFFYRT
jgi:hypothetical protein